MYWYFVLIMAESYAFVWIYHIFFIAHQLMDIWVISIFLAIMNNTAMEIYIQDFAWIHVFISFGHIPRSGLAMIILSLIY